MSVEIKYKDYDYFHEYTNIKDYYILYKCLCCNKNYRKQFLTQIHQGVREMFYNFLITHPNFMNYGDFS